MLVVHEGDQMDTSNLHSDDRRLVLLCLCGAAVLLYNRELHSKRFLPVILPHPISDIFMVVLADSIY